MRSINSHVCMYCGETFQMESLNWLIQERALDSEKAGFDRRTNPPLYDGKADSETVPDSLSETDPPLEEDWGDDEEWGAENPFRTVMTSHFSDKDELGRYFYSRMISSVVSGDSSARTLPNKHPMIVRAEHFNDDLGENKGNHYRAPDGEIIPIFEKPAKAGRVSLRFTQAFIESMDRQGDSTLKVRRKFIEEECIRAVCPWCTSFLPDELFDDEQECYVAKFGFIGPRESGKTTMNVVNILLNCLTRGGWSLNKAKYLAVTHYLSDSGGNYYKKVFQTGMLPEITQPLDYVPPLLLRLNRRGRKKRLLLVLMDVAGEFLQGLAQKVEVNEKDERDVLYQRLLNEMDGYLLTMDAERELLPLTMRANMEKDESAVTLEKLMGICSALEQFHNKPAALILTKCDRLFQNKSSEEIYGLSEEEFQTMFRDFTPLEQAYWQQPEDPTTVMAPYQADRHELVQFSFKPFIQKNFRILWELMQCFSRVDVFPESSIGNTQWSMEDIKKNKIDSPTIDLQPFHSADPIFWLLDMIGGEERVEAPDEEQ